MGPKKQMKSPFGLFMTKMRLQNNSLQKQTFDKTLQYCDHLYKQLTEEEKKPFETLSQNIRLYALNDQQIYQRLRQLKTISHDNSQDSSQDNWDNNEIAVNTTQYENMAKQESVEVLDDYSRVKSAIESQKDIKCIPIVVIALNLLVKTIDGKHYPNEISLVKFTLIDGIQESYHKLIYNQIPKGYYTTAQELAAVTHQIPLQPNDNPLYVRDYGLLFNEIYEFMDSTVLSDSQNKKLIFCKPMDRTGNEEKLQIIGCLEWLEKEANKEFSHSSDFSDFQICDLSELLYFISSPLITRPRSLYSDDLSKAVYDYTTNTNCQYHQQIENKYCTLGVVKRLSYLFFDCSLNFFNIKPKVSHKPIEQDLAKTQVSIIRFRDYDKRIIRNNFKTNPITVDSTLTKDSDHNNYSVVNREMPDKVWVTQGLTFGKGRGKVNNKSN